MGVIERAGMLGRFRDYLLMQGYDVEEVEDYDKVQQLVDAAEKPYLTPISSPSHNDFTRTNALWLVARRNGDPAFLGCARLEDLGDEPVDRYWQRVMRRAYGAAGGEAVFNHRMEIGKNVGGRLAYFGDLYVAKGTRGSLLNLKTFVMLGHLAVSLKWDPDVTYCFLREKDVNRGAAINYGFTSVSPAPFDWVDPPETRGESEWLALLPRSELVPVSRQLSFKVTQAVEQALLNSKN